MIIWLEDNQILESVYGDSMHTEVIKRSLPLLRFYNKKKKLSKEKINWLWKLSQEKHAVFREIILKNIADLVK